MKFYKWTNEDLANYMADLLAYNDEDACKEAKRISSEIVTRFLAKYADSGDCSEDCEDFHFTDG